MDIRQFSDTMRERMKAAHSHTKLRMRRENCYMSQSELAEEADVPFRQSDTVGTSNGKVAWLSR